MSTNLKLFAWFFAVSFFAGSFRLRAAPLGLLVLIGPTFALFQLVWLQNLLAPKEATHWLFKVPGLLAFRGLLTKGLALPLWGRLLALVACLAGGLGLSKLLS